MSSGRPGAAAGGPSAPPPTAATPSPRDLQARGSDTWRQLAIGGPPGAPGPGGLSGPMGGPAVTLHMPEGGPRGAPLSPRGRSSLLVQDPPETAGDRTWGGPRQRGSRASLGLPAVPQSPRGAASRRGSEVGIGMGKKEDSNKERGCLLQQAAAAGLRGVPCPRCNFVVPLQQVVQCAQWQLQRGEAWSRSLKDPIRHKEPLDNCLLYIQVAN